jgi:hypothetical protein
MREDLELAEQIGLGGTPEHIAAYARLIRMEFYDAVRSEYDTWQGDYKNIVKVALTHCLQRIDPDATL